MSTPKFRRPGSANPERTHAMVRAYIGGSTMREIADRWDLSLGRIRAILACQAPLVIRSVGRPRKRVK